jgi:GrpB-like predicted nucleotidyltransferase (UPF0157 family)
LLGVTARGNERVKKVKIEIVPYNPAWLAEFHEIGKQIRDAVGHAALTIHHIGSTSVPGLSAKDLIDVQMGAADFSMAWKARIEAIGFEYRDYTRDHCPPGMELSAEQLEKRFFRMNNRAVNLHIRVPGRFNFRYALLFRDYLRAHPAAANAYGVVKENLARYFPTDADAYYAIKDPVCDCIMAGAFEWARSTEWKPGPSDA